jgi:hypothetical protein
MKASKMDQRRYYLGVPMISYDLIKELVLAVVVLGLVTLGLAVVFSSPDEPSVNIKSWSNADPVDFVTTAAAELGGTSDTATYGPPYVGGPAQQAIGPFAPAGITGDSMHIDTAQLFVLDPLGTISAGDKTVADAITTWRAASSDQQQTWVGNYTDALANATVSNATVNVPAGDYGPVPDLMAAELQLAQDGSLDGILLTSPGAFYQTNYSAPLLFMGDGGYLAGLAEQQHLLGDQWGMMNETGQYPGQTWLWLYTLWYQVPPFDTADNADLLIVLLMGGLTLLLALVPFIPILRDIPRWIPVHRLIWRRSAYTPREMST